MTAAQVVGVSGVSFLMFVLIMTMSDHWSKDEDLTLRERLAWEWVVMIAQWVGILLAIVFAIALAVAS
jgi:hypothetical protein